MDKIGDNEQGPSRKEFNLLMGLVIGISVVISITLITLVIQYFTATQATFEDLKDQVVRQNVQIDYIDKYNSKIEKLIENNTALMNQARYYPTQTQIQTQPKNTSGGPLQITSY